MHAGHASQTGRLPHFLRILQTCDYKAKVVASESKTDLQVLQCLVQVDVAVRLASVEKVHRCAFLGVLQRGDLFQLKGEVL